MIDEDTLHILREFVPGDGPGKYQLDAEYAMAHADRVAMAAEIVALRRELHAATTRAAEYEGGMRLMMHGAMGLLERVA